MNMLKELDRICAQIEASQMRLAKEFGQQTAWDIIKAYLKAYTATHDKLVEKGAI